MNLTTPALHATPIESKRCTSCHKPTAWKVGDFRLCSDCIVKQCERPAKAETMVTTSLRMTPAELAENQAYAAKYGLTFAEFVRGALAMMRDGGRG